MPEGVLISVPIDRLGVAQWQLQLVPKPGTAATPTMAILSGRTSNEARAAAMAKYPNHVVGAIKRLGP